MYFCIKSSMVTQGEVSSCKSALNPPPPVVYSYDCSKAVVPVLVLLFVALFSICFMSCLVLFCCCVF